MHYFFLGNTPDLSLLELESLYDGSFIKLKEGIFTSEIKLELSSLDRLGGTRKVASLLKISSAEHLIKDLTELIIADGAKNIALTDYASSHLESAQIIGIKQAVRAHRPVRFVSTQTTEHELLMLSHQHVTELNLLPHQDGIALAKTVWIYDAESWVLRDRQKPYRDIKRGMLPPKLARIMVNLATRGKPRTLFDPFCGTGTILTEALLLGCRVIGSDTDARAVEGAGENCVWLAKTYALPDPHFTVMVSDATHPNTQLPSIECVATEPYMGPLIEDRYVPSVDKLKNIARGLDKLYRGAFHAWYKLLPEQGRVVIAIPKFVAYNRTIETISVDTLAALGYNHISSAAYGKPGAVVIRHITVLEKRQK